jgi:hypothetical protein
MIGFLQASRGVGIRSSSEQVTSLRLDGNVHESLRV